MSDPSKNDNTSENDKVWLEQADKLASDLGFYFPTPLALEYNADFRPPVQLTCGLIMVPHGKTPANIEHLFQSHSDAQHSQLTPEGREMAVRGAKSFAETYGGMMRDSLDDWVLYRSPLTRTADTAAPYLEALRAVDTHVAEPIVDKAIIEITHGSWDGFTVKDLDSAGRSADSEAAKQYREGSFTAKALDGSGESKIEVVARASEWLRWLEAKHGGGNTNVLVFGHGTFQNSVEILLRCYPDLTIDRIFSRNVTGGSHLKRGEAHILSPIRTRPMGNL
eukprot:TRINITY_DN48169_c0_g1_i1.p1 TRINITY_DN48169_c0_g1~~TRINITY_DN48169_c0_g1_i1.p1  ORF type:complete len:298 (+),score=51.62 TRINITY_DN48169_c0_g1_i1:59-895(+)